MRIHKAPSSCVVSTPAELAQAMVETLRDTPGSTWLDPCAGTGAFLRALSTAGVSPQRIIGVDLERCPAGADVYAKVSRGIDFLAWARITPRRFDRIIANPPYVALTRLIPTLRREALKVSQPDGKTIRLGSNYWYAFLCGSLPLLKRGGSICFVLPASWDFANYAEPLRELLPKSFARFEVHRCEKPLFNSVQDGCVIIIGRSFRHKHISATRVEYKSFQALLRGLREPLRKHRKHAPVPKQASPTSPQTATRLLRDILEIRLGGVTGHSKYFLLTEAERLRHQIPRACVVPIVSKASHLVDAQLSLRQWTRLRNKGERIWLFAPPRRFRHHPAVQTYTRLSPQKGGCIRYRYKIRMRKPWYKVPLDKKIDGFMSGMSRFGPWISLKNMPRLNASNTLYTVRFKNSRPLNTNIKSAWALSLLTSFTREFIKPFGRLYPDGLVKFEPGDLQHIPLLIPHKTKSAAFAYRQAVIALLSGREKLCREVADAYILEGKIFHCK